MKRFYKYKIGEHERYYTNLKKLCEQESINYVNVYYSVVRQKNEYWTDDNCEVFLLYFSGV